MSEYMVSLVAERKGVKTDSFLLQEGESKILGRGEGADLRVPGESYLSRRHATVTLKGSELHVELVEGAANPMFFDGEESDAFVVSSEGFFVVGDTRFRLSVATEASTAFDDSLPSLERSLTEDQVYAFGPGSDRMRLKDLLALPEMIRTIRNPSELYSAVAGFLRLLTAAKWSCVLDGEGNILARDSVSDRGGFKISRRLLAKAVEDAPLPVAYGWKGGAGEATAVEGIDWAACAAVRLPGGGSLCFYSAGSDSEAGLEETTRYVGLVADVVGRAVVEDRQKALQGRLEHFFSRAVVDKIVSTDAQKELEPRLAQATVLFFDIRGFSKRTEENNEALLGYLETLRKALSVVTEVVLEEEGVVIQYTGDGLLACWNVPFPHEDHIDRGCRAALRMQEALADATGGWECGIGLHTGEVVAGAIGSEQIFLYGVMGVVVNQASRVEGLTKEIGAPLLVTEGVALGAVSESISKRRVGRYRPQGMETTLDLYELSEHPADSKSATVFREGMAAFEAGRFDEAKGKFDSLSEDAPACYLARLCERYAVTPPENWDGTISVETK